MKEKCKKDKRTKSYPSKDCKVNKNESKRRRNSSASNSTDSEEWVEKGTKQTNIPAVEREDWMSMTGMLKTYTKDDMRPKREERDKNHIDSYNPATSSRELNPYWKSGGTGLPQSSESFRKSRQFLKPSDDEDYYSKSSKKFQKSTHSNHYESSNRLQNDHKKDHTDYYKKSCNWKKSEHSSEKNDPKKETVDQEIKPTLSNYIATELKQGTDSKYLSDEKMNKLGAKLIKAEIMGDMKLVAELKTKLDAAREYRKQNPDANKQDDGVMLISTNSSGNSRPLTSAAKGDPQSRGGKRKAETHVSGERMKYFGNDDKYNLAQMFQEEKYGNNYNEEAELAKIAGKLKNPNDDLEDIFMDEISKNRNAVKDNEIEKQRAINQHVKMERTLEGCEYCIDSKNMLKHLMVSCGNKVYLALPSRKSLVKNQCIITTIQHMTCVTALDEDVWEEIMNYRKALTQFYNSQNKDVVFFETATKLHRYPHMVINCIPLPRDEGDMAAIYFKKALLECEAEWSMNKKVVELKGKNIRKGVPKGLPYFWIDFGMDPGFAHVIEDQQLFPRTFAEEVIGGMLDLDHSLWKNPRKEYGDVQRKKVLDFIKEWKSFEPQK